MSNQKPELLLDLIKQWLSDKSHRGFLFAAFTVTSTGSLWDVLTSISGILQLAFQEEFREKENLFTFIFKSDLPQILISLIVVSCIILADYLLANFVLDTISKPRRSINNKTFYKIFFPIWTVLKLFDFWTSFLGVSRTFVKEFRSEGVDQNLIGLWGVIESEKLETLMVILFISLMIVACPILTSFMIKPLQDILDNE